MLFFCLALPSSSAVSLGGECWDDVEASAHAEAAGTKDLLGPSALKLAWENNELNVLVHLMMCMKHQVRWRRIRSTTSLKFLMQLDPLHR